MVSMMMTMMMMMLKADFLITEYETLSMQIC